MTDYLKNLWLAIIGKYNIVHVRRVILRELNAHEVKIKAKRFHWVTLEVWEQTLLDASMLKGLAIKLGFMKPLSKEEN